MIAAFVGIRDSGNPIDKHTRSVYLFEEIPQVDADTSLC